MPRKVIYKAVALGAFAASQLPSIAADTTVSGAVTTTQTVTGGSTLTITETGSITTTGSGQKGVTATGGSNTVINNGTITTSGSTSSDAIQATGGSNRIINNGTINTTGNSSRGISATGDNNTITNTGSINTVNSAAIRTGTGVADSNGNTITNSGSILTTGIGSIGINAKGNSNTINNTGSIITTGGADGPQTADGIYAQGSNNTVTNHGTIISYYGKSIVFTGSGNTLNLANSSFLGGEIDFGAGTQVNVSTGANYSKVISYSGSQSGVNTSGPIPVFVNTGTKQLATYDPTILAASSDALGDMTSSISSLSPGRFGATGGDHPFWAKAFGITSSYAGTEATLNRKYNYSGAAIGYDISKTQSTTFGILGGYGQTSLTTSGTEMQSYNRSSDDGFWGIYAQKAWKKTWLSFGLYGGVQDFRQQRYINDNLAYLGNASAQSTFSGWWIAPEAAITYKVAEFGGWSVLPTARLSYASQWMSSYTETGGSSGNATFNTQNVAVGQSFVGIGTKKSVKTNTGKNTKINLEGQVGYLYRGTAGSQTVGVTLVGQTLSLPTETQNRNTFAATAGMSIDLSSAVALKIRADAATGDGMNYVGGGWAGLSVQF